MFSIIHATWGFKDKRVDIDISSFIVGNFLKLKMESKYFNKIAPNKIDPRKGYLKDLQFTLFNGTEVQLFDIQCQSGDNKREVNIDLNVGYQIGNITNSQVTHEDGFEFMSITLIDALKLIRI